MTKSASFNANNEDTALFLLIKKRDREAFTIIYDKYHQYLYVLAERYLKNSEIAEEIVQQVFVKLWETTENINIRINLKNYLYTMTKNLILNTFRDNKEIISLSYERAQIDLKDENADFLKMLEDSQLISMLHEGINSLPPRKREICLKKISENKSNQQIAKEMHISVNTVKAHYQESIKMLRQYFKKIK